jgi:choline kinase
MKAIILCAGLGTRLKSQVPKSLSPLKNEKTIIDYQIEYLSKRIGMENIILVVGHKKELFIKKFPKISFIENKNYSTTNTSKSLLVGLNKLSEDVIWLNGDIYFDEKVLDLLLKNTNSCSLVNKNDCGSEEVKYSLDESGNIKNLSKEVSPSKGESLGINLIKKNELDNFRLELTKVNDSDYFEKALENLIVNNKLVLKPVYIGNLFCKEIDFPQDLEKVKNYLSQRP